MEEAFRCIVAYAALLLESFSAIILLYGGCEAMSRTFIPILKRASTEGLRRTAWQSFARWLLLGLEFMLAADVIRTAIAPTWNEIGQLAAIAVIRTFLNYFLERDIRNTFKETDRELVT